MSKNNNISLYYPSNFICGVTLLECLITMALGMFLLFALLSLYLSTKTTWKSQQALVTIQENGRFISHYLAQKIYAIGDNSCMPTASVSTDYIHGYTADQMQALLPNRLIHGTDVIILQECSLSQQSIQYLPLAYFIADTQRKNDAGQPIYALYEKRGDSPCQELVENIISMQIEYGISNASRAELTYQTSENVNNWNEVRSVVVHLILSSNDMVFNSSASERRLLKPWEIYAAIRKTSSY